MHINGGFPAHQTIMVQGRREIRRLARAGEAQREIAAAMRLIAKVLT